MASPPHPRAKQPRAELPGRPRRRPGSGRGRAMLRTAGFVAVLLAAFGAVVWRQTRAVERERELRGLRNELAVAEGEKVELANRIQALQSRARIVRVAKERLGLHLPTDEEIVLLPVPAGAARVPADSAGAK